MSKQKLHIRELKNLDFPSEVTRSLALNIINRHFKHLSNEEKINVVIQVLEKPDVYKSHETLAILAIKLISRSTHHEPYKCYELEDDPKQFTVFGNKHIESAAIKQMELAMRLPVSEQGSLMPDAHPGYGLPIGGVLVTRNAVIPYGVGMDIGCRMGGSPEEAPGAYKDIELIMKSQTNLVKIEGTFHPRVVRMAKD